MNFLLEILSSRALEDKLVVRVDLQQDRTLKKLIEAMPHAANLSTTDGTIGPIKPGTY